MDAPLYSPEVVRELAVLRRRAYGPDADIQSDPVAQARLAELEKPRPVHDLPTTSDGPRDTAARLPDDRPPGRLSGTAPGARTIGAPSALTPSAPSVRSEPRAANPGSLTDTPAVEPDSSPAVRRRAVRPWWRRRSALAIATAATVALVVAASAVVFAVRGPSPEKSLPTTGDKPTTGQLEAMGWMFGVYSINSKTITGHGTFARISVWTADTWDDRRCVILTTIAQGGFGASCTRPGLDPTIDFQRYPGTSDPLDGAFPDLTVIRFVARSGVVDVWVQLPPEPSLRADAR